MKVKGTITWATAVKMHMQEIRESLSGQNTLRAQLDAISKAETAMLKLAKAWEELSDDNAHLREIIQEADERALHKQVWIDESIAGQLDLLDGFVDEDDPRTLPQKLIGKGYF